MIASSYRELMRYLRFLPASVANLLELNPTSRLSGAITSFWPQKDIGQIKGQGCCVLIEGRRSSSGRLEHCESHTTTQLTVSLGTGSARQ